MKASTLRHLTYVSHMALGFSGAMFFLAMTGIALFFGPRTAAMLAHADAAATNLTDATAVWAKAAGDQAHQVDLIARDTRASIVATGRTVDKMKEVAGTAQTQLEQLGPLLESLKKSSDAIPPAIGHIDEVADEATDMMNQSTNGIVPLLMAYTDIATNVNGYLRRKAVSDFVDNLGPLSTNAVAISGTGSHMLVTADQVETKATYTYLHPSPNPWVRTWNAAEPWLQIGAQGLVKIAPVIH
jgi:hypothetical protein